MANGTRLSRRQSQAAAAGLPQPLRRPETERTLTGALQSTAGSLSTGGVAPDPFSGDADMSMYDWCAAVEAAVSARGGGAFAWKQLPPHVRLWVQDQWDWAPSADEIAEAILAGRYPSA